MLLSVLAALRFNNVWTLLQNRGDVQLHRSRAVLARYAMAPSVPRGAWSSMIFMVVVTVVLPFGGTDFLRGPAVTAISQDDSSGCNGAGHGPSPRAGIPAETNPGTPALPAIDLFGAMG